MPYVWSILVGYAVGTLNPAFLLAKLRGFDIRERGSHNAGASNALILFGKAVGLFCAAFDIAKAVVVIRLNEWLFPASSGIFAVSAVACMLGHIFPFYMRFRGGKGLACLAGTILAYDLRVFAVMLAMEVAVALLTKYICFVPMTASVIFPFVYGIREGSPAGALLFGLIAVIILARHTENLHRIREGREMRLSYLWSKKKETERLRAHYSDEEPN